MNIERPIRPILGLVAAFSLVACGGGSSGDNSPIDPPPSAVPLGVTAIGSITGFGSVFVNGNKFDIDSGSVIAIEGQEDVFGDDSALRLGMKVRVSALEENGVRTALRIEYDDDLKGPIESITPDGSDPTIGTFSLMGQTVTVNADTVFDDDVGNNDGIAGIDFRDLQPGMIVEVSGFPTDDGYLATRVDRELDNAGNDPIVGDPDVDDDELELKGFVESVASDLSSIIVSGTFFAIDPTSTIFEDGLVLSEGLVGTFVEVKADIVGDEFLAVRVEREDDFNDEDHDGEFEIEGVLQSVDTSSTPHTFTINGITVPVNDASTLEPLVGLHIEIEGEFNASGVLILREAHEEEEDNVRTEDLVASVDIEGGSFTTRLGLVISPTGESRIEDDTSSDGDHLTPAQFLGRLQQGDRVETRGFEDASGGVIWTGVEREETAASNSDFECELRGPVQSFTGDASAFSFVIRDVTVETGRMQEEDFKDENELPIGRALFFDRLQTLPVVEAESFEGDEFCMTGLLDARQVEIE